MCPIHNVKEVHIEAYLMKCPVNGCNHYRYSPVPNKKFMIKVSLPFWCNK